MHPIHIGITSVLFDAKPEGLCTARLIRALLAAGHRITLFTSDKARTDFTHANLKVHVYPSRPRYPRAVFDALAKLRGHIPNNFYLWGRKVAAHALTSDDVPDLFYGRAWPHAGLVASYELAKQFDRPLMLHFSDPFPPPNESVPDQPFFNDLQTIVDRASLITMTNQASVDYQKQFLKQGGDKLRILHHVAPETDSADDALPRTPYSYYYLGAIAPPRPARLLLEGFKQHLQQYPKARLNFVGSRPEHLQTHIAELELEQQVVIHPYTQQPQRFIDAAAGLISVDVNAQPALYTPTKIVDYLMSDRPVLALTPAGSPVSELISGDKTGVAVTEYNAKAIADGFNALAQIEATPEQSAQRKAMMQDFSPAGVAAQFDRLLDEIFKSTAPSHD